MESKNKSVKREINRNEGGKPKPVHSRKAPLVAGLVAATALALGACSVRDEKPVENKKGTLVAEPKKIECEKKIEENISKVLSPVLLGQHQILVDPCYLFEDPWPNEKSGIITVKNVTIEESTELAQKILDAINAFWKNTPMGPADDRTHFRGSIGKLEYENGILKITVDVSIVNAEPKTKTAEVFMSEVEVPENAAEAEAYTATVKEGSKLSIGDTSCLEVTKIDEEGVEVAWPVPLDTDIFDDIFGAIFGPERDYHPRKLKIPYGHSFTDPAGVLPEVEPKRGDKPGEAKITVTWISRSKSE